MADNLKHIFEIQSSALSIPYLLIPGTNEKGNEPLTQTPPVWESDPRRESGIVGKVPNWNQESASNLSL